MNTMPIRRLTLLLSALSLGFPLIATADNAPVQPSGITLAPLQQQQFKVNGYGQNLIWSVRPTGMGIITPTGLYTASVNGGVAFIYARPTGGTSAYLAIVNQTGEPASVSNSGGTTIVNQGGLNPLPTEPAAPVPYYPIPLQPYGGTPTQSSGGSMSINPSMIFLQARQSVLFTALVQGVPSQNVQWSISPNMGSIVNGFYTAPASNGSDTQVTITATNLIDSSMTATATVMLGQPFSTPVPPPSNVSISVAPSAATLTPGQTAQFTATVQGANYDGVLWSVTPNLGSVFNGLYTAPATITSPQTVTLNAVSAADPTQSATASITLQPVANVTISLSPGNASLNGGQSTTFTPTVSGTSNTAVTWSLNPQVGTVANGVYQAPGIIPSLQTVTITATSAADSTKSASATVALQPIGVTVGPTSASLVSGQSATFTASVTGTGNTGVTWSLNPAVGTVVNGVYTAPVAINNSQTVTITATSVVDSTKSASATVALAPIGVTVGPASASLSSGQSATFTAAVTGTGNTAVTWSLNPAVGTVVNGVYTAPVAINNSQTVTITATSVVDSTKTASATVALQPIAVTVGPASATLGAGQSASFTASVTGTSNTGVTWSLNPAVGTVVNGVYTAPASIGNAQTVTITATSVVDSSKSATASVSLTASSNPPPSTITLPLEVIGPNGTTVTATVNIPNGSNLTGQMSLWMQIHGLRSQTQASVQVNNSAWIPINSSSVTLLGNANAYGGIGGGFSTLTMTMNIPAGAIQTGANTINFMFNQTDGRVSGFRVLAFNVQAADGTQLIPASAFVQDDPNSWQPPSSNPSDIATGQTLWRTASLTIPVVTGGTQTIQAHCTDCHAQDGRDLKYFNYSNNSIQTRALFHGLTAQQGQQIASYIRTLNVPNPGRPWNPPYQPGPGLDSQPVSNWAAGAGLSAVLDSDQEMLNAIFPSGIQPAVFAATSRLNQRELPLPLQLPDWNQWLPGTHPMDAFGATFTTSGYNTVYQTLSSTLQVNNPTVYAAQQMTFEAWFGAFYSLYQQLETPIQANQAAMWTPATVDAMYSLSQWGLVKSWELNNQFQLEGLAQSIFGPQADPRAWYSNLPFFVSPHELEMPTTGAVGLRNGTQPTYVYLSYIWYNMQLILNDSNGTQQEGYPIDWPYSNGFVMNLAELLQPQGGIQTMWLLKGLEILQQAGTGPQLGAAGWQPSIPQISLLVTPEWNDYVWNGVDPNTRVAIATGLVQSWLQQASQFTPQQFYAGGWTTPTAVPVPFGNAYDQVFPDWVWYMIPRFTFIGVDPTLVGQLAAWAQTIWPNANWTADLNATCSWQNNTPNDVLLCSQ